MSKHAVIAIALATLLAGCAGSQHNNIPVVERGGSLTPGAMRDRSAGSATQQTERSAATVEEKNEDIVQTYAIPSTPISGIQVHHDDASSGQSKSNTSAPSMSIGGQARLAADEQLSGPVLALLTTAKQQQNGGDFNGAASSVERAQRIAPREPQVLYRLAEVRLAQGDASQAEQLAQRGLGYSNGQSALQAGLWDLVARARAQQGNTAGAEEARRRARVNL